MVSFLCRSLIGRQAELDLLTARLDAPRGGAVFILGEAGVGKTRLVREMVETGKGSRPTGAGGPVRSGPAGHALSAVRRGAARRLSAHRYPGGCPTHPVPARPRPVDPAVASTGGSIGRVGRGARRGNPAHARRAQRRRAGAARPGRSAVGGSGIVERSGIPRRSRRGRVAGLCGNRKAGTFAGADAGAGLPRPADRVRACEVRPLSAPETTAMAVECLGASALPDGLDHLLARAEGVPFLVEELLSAAVDVNALVCGPTGWIRRRPTLPQLFRNRWRKPSPSGSTPWIRPTATCPVRLRCSADGSTRR